MYLSRFAPLALVCLLGACAVNADEGAEAGGDGADADGAGPVLGQTEQALLECPNWACGQNGPTLNNREFHELSEVSATANAEGFHLGPLVQNSLVYQVHVIGSQLSANRTGSPTLTGAALIGAYFLIAHESNFIVRVYITEVIEVPLWAGPRKGQRTEAYRLMWQEPSGERRHNLCAKPPTDKPKGGELLNLPGEFTVLFEGNRYDAKSKTLLPASREWFNLGCASHALSKLFLTGHTTLTGSAPEAQQQAVLKMLTADYCGDGTSFTLGGEPLLWKTSNGYMDYFGTPHALEARWNDKGAVCLDNPRMKSSKNPAAPQVFPDIWDAIAQHCPQAMPPPCDSSDTRDFAGAMVLSSNGYNE